MFMTIEYFQRNHIHTPLGLTYPLYITVFQEAVQLNPIFQGSSPEDTFIEQMALGRIVVWNNKQHIEASSLEGLITHVIEVT